MHIQPQSVAEFCNEMHRAALNRKSQSLAQAVFNSRGRQFSLLKACQHIEAGGNLLWPSMSTLNPDGAQSYLLVLLKMLDL